MTIDIKSDRDNDKEGLPKKLFAVIFHWGDRPLAWKRRGPGGQWLFQDDFITAIKHLHGLPEALIAEINKQDKEEAP